MTSIRASRHALLTPDEMSAADAAAIALGVPGLALMEAAGLAVAEAVCRRWPRRSVLILCGPGNNGGDGFVAARHLSQRGWPVRVVLLGRAEQLSADAAHHASLWTGGVSPFSEALLDDAQLVIDAVFGAGLSRPLGGAVRQVLESVARSGLPVCAVDLPSGLDGATGQVHGFAVKADLTVTFFRKKPGHLLLPGRQLCGEVILADIGIPQAALDPARPPLYENHPELWLPQYPWPDISGHKYQRGHVLIVGGKLMTGAARLSAMGAARAGAGLVTLAAPASAWAVYAGALTSVMVQPFDEAQELASLLADVRKSVIVVGPGAGVSKSTREQVLTALATRRAVVLDADAISSFEKHASTLLAAIAGPCVLTPHEGEFARIFDCQGSKLERARSAAHKSGAVILLKGADTVIAAPDGHAIINANGPPDLATGGTGDVLTGLIAGLAAQGLEPFFAAAAAAWLHGEAARLFGPGLIAEDLPAILPRVLRRLKKSAFV